MEWAGICTPQGSILANLWSAGIAWTWTESEGQTPQWHSEDCIWNVITSWLRMFLRDILAKIGVKDTAVKMKIEPKTSDNGENLSMIRWGNVLGGTTFHLTFSPAQLPCLHRYGDAWGCKKISLQGHPTWGASAPCLVLFKVNFLTSCLSACWLPPGLSQSNLWASFWWPDLNCIFLYVPWQSACSLIKDFQAASPILPSPLTSYVVDFKAYF